MTKRAGVLSRVSTVGQVDNTSLGEQERVCREYAANRGWTVAGIYTDKAMSGVDSQRPAYQRMLADARDGKIDAVIALEGSRFSRDEVERLHQRRLLVTQYGVAVVFIRDGEELDPDDPDVLRKLIPGDFRAILDGEERRRTMVRTMAGRRAKLRSGGQFVGGEPPYGYRVVGQGRDARVLPDEDERRALRVAYDRVVTHTWSTPMVCEELDSLGMRPRRAQRWTSAVLRRALRHDVLVTGRVLWGAPKDDTTRGRMRSTATTPTGAPRHGDPISIEYGAPVFSEEEWRALQRALDGLAARRNVRGNRKQTSQLMTLRIEAECSSTYYGVSLANSTKSQTSHAYRCGGRRAAISANDRCRDGQINGPWLDEWVWTSVVEMLTDGDRLTTMARDWLRSQVIAPSELEALTAQRDRLANQRARALDLMLESPTLADSLHRRAEELEEGLHEVQARIDAAAASHAESASRRWDVLDLVALASGARERLETMNPASRAEVIRLLNVEVKVGPVYRGRPVRAEIATALEGLSGLALPEIGEK